MPPSVLALARNSDAFLPVFPITDYGAVPGTASSGPDCLAAIVAAIAAAQAAGGGTVYIPPGEWWVNSLTGTGLNAGILVPANVKILGAGKWVTIINHSVAVAGNAGPLFNLLDASSLGTNSAFYSDKFIGELTINAFGNTQLGTSAVGIYLGNFIGATVRNVEILQYGLGYGLALVQSSTTQTVIGNENLLLDRVRIGFCTYGLYIGQTTWTSGPPISYEGFKAFGLYIYGGAASGNSWAIYVDAHVNVYNAQIYAFIELDHLTMYGIAFATGNSQIVAADVDLQVETTLSFPLSGPITVFSLPSGAIFRSNGRYRITQPPSGTHGFIDSITSGAIFALNDNNGSTPDGNAAATAIAANGIIATNNSLSFTDGPSCPNNVVRVNPGAACIGVIMAKGSMDGQTCLVVNESTTHSLTMDVSGTSNVADGSSCVLSANRSMLFVWSPNAGLWYHT